MNTNQIDMTTSLRTLLLIHVKAKANTIIYQISSQKGKFGWGFRVEARRRHITVPKTEKSQSLSYPTIHPQSSVVPFSQTCSRESFECLNTLQRHSIKYFRSQEVVSSNPENCTLEPTNIGVLRTKVGDVER